MVAHRTTTGRDVEESVTPVFRHALPKADQRDLVAVVVTYPPGGGSAIHRHAPSAFIYAHVMSGRIRSQLEGQPAEIYESGQGFFENPGSHHVVSENASSTEAASMLAIFIVDPDDAELTVADRSSGPSAPDGRVPR